jgi:hypothetical protein
MDIHPPHGSITSWRQFGVQLLTITIGILIALSFEGILEWRHHRSLMYEARDNITAEIRSNASQLRNTQKDFQASEMQLQQILNLVHRVQADRRTKAEGVVFNWSIAELHQTNWTTANVTGAIVYMDYSEVNRYTRVYDLQQDFMTLQQQAFLSSRSVQALSSLRGRDFKKINDAELGDIEHTVGLALANTQALEQVGHALADQYAKFQ